MECGLYLLILNGLEAPVGYLIILMCYTHVELFMTFLSPVKLSKAVIVIFGSAQPCVSVIYTMNYNKSFDRIKIKSIISFYQMFIKKI